MIKNLIPRLYQEAILATCALKNTLVVLPTGLGKTAIAILLAAQRLKTWPESKILILAPTKPLCIQHRQSFMTHLDLNENEFALLTGEVPAIKRQAIWEKSRIIFATPQGIENDILNNAISLENVALVVFDEAHRAVGNYSYVTIAKIYLKKSKFPRILGLTASPGSEIDKVKTICSNLGIEKIEARNEQDWDVKPYIQLTKIIWHQIPINEKFLPIIRLLKNCFYKRLSALNEIGIKTSELKTKKAMLDFYKKFYEGKNLRAFLMVAQLIKIQHAQELIETQGIAATLSYFEKLYNLFKNSKSKVLAAVCNDEAFKGAYLKTKDLADQGIEHNKIEFLKNLLKEEIQSGARRVLIFTQYRDTAIQIEKEIRIPNVKAALFFGQAKKAGIGMNQKLQAEIIEKFRNGVYNVLVATSVAEEGIDIPSVDVVIFYEPVPSAIRTIQRRGRTGRLAKGKVHILYTKNTRDEAYYWSSKAKERNMAFIIKKLKEIKIENEENQIKADDGNKIKIYADYREKNSLRFQNLIASNVEIGLKHLDCADYVLSDRVAVEIKTAEDFVQSIVDNRLLNQLENLAFNYSKPIILIEGDKNLYELRAVHPNAIRGMMATIAVDYGIPIIFTSSPKETSEFLIAIAKREQSNNKNEFNPHNGKKPKSLEEQKIYFISALPKIGPKMAKKLFDRFGNIKALVNSKADEFRQIQGIGRKTSQMLQEFFEK